MDLLDQMQTFVRVVDSGSLSAAARIRRLSLAAVSRQLAALEEDLGATLIVRSTRRLQITASGHRWYEHCSRILQGIDDARADVAESDEPRGSVVISAPMTLGLMFVVPRVERISAKYPHLQIDVRLEDHVVDLVGEGVDIALRGGVAPPDSTSIIAVPALRFRRVAVASREYLKKRGTPKHPRDLAKHDGLLHITGAQGAGARGGATMRQWVFERERERERERDPEVVEASPRIRLRSTAPLALRDWAIAGAGIAHIPEWAVSKSLQRLFPDWQSPEINAWALHRIEQRHAPRIRVVVEALTR